MLHRAHFAMAPAANIHHASPCLGKNILLGGFRMKAYDQLSLKYSKLDASTARLAALLEANGLAILKDAWPTALEASALEASRALFLQSDEWKEAHRTANPRSGGFIAYGMTHALDTGIANLLEGWCLSPASDAPPLDIPGSQIFQQVAAKLHVIADNVIVALRDHLDGLAAIEGLVERSSYQLYALYYPARLLGKVDGAVRQSLHADSSIFTLLPRASCPGLLARVGTRLIPLHLLPGDMALISGTVLEYLTAGRFPACQHSVETPNDAVQRSDRLSLVYFVDARPEAVIEPFAHTSEHRASYPAISVGELLRTSYGSVYADDQTGSC